jgi:hypothetical protein
VASLNSSVAADGRADGPEVWADSGEFTAEDAPRTSGP